MSTKCYSTTITPFIYYIFSGYIRFLNDRRDQFRAENPNLLFAEITKVLATEWNQLPADKKQVIVP